MPRLIYDQANKLNLRICLALILILCYDLILFVFGKFLLLLIGIGIIVVATQKIKQRSLIRIAAISLGILCYAHAIVPCCILLVITLAVVMTIMATNFLEPAAALAPAKSAAAPISPKPNLNATAVATPKLKFAPKTKPSSTKQEPAPAVQKASAAPMPPSVEGQHLNTADTQDPSKKAMQAQLLGLLQAPAAGIARIINTKVSKANLRATTASIPKLKISPKEEPSLTIQVPPATPVAAPPTPMPPK